MTIAPSLNALSIHNTPLAFTLAALITGHTLPQEVPPAVWESLITLARKQAVLPMLHAQVRARMPELTALPLWASVTASVMRTAAKLSAILGAQSEVTQALDAADVPVIWLKGAALCHTIYPEKTLRPMVDGDCLVPFAEREKALQVIEGLGFSASYHPSVFVVEVDNQRAGELYHHYVLQRGEVLLELHFSLFPDPALLPGEAMNWFWSQTEPINALLRGFAPEAQILHLAAHLFLHHHDLEPDLLHLLDFHLLLQARRINWEVVVDRAVILGWTRAVEQALKFSGAWFGSAQPEGIVEALQTRRPGHEQELITQQQEGLGSFGKNWRRLQGFSPSQKLGLVMGAFFPPQENLRERFKIPAQQSVVFVYPRLWGHLIRKTIRWVMRGKPYPRS